MKITSESLAALIKNATAPTVPGIRWVAAQESFVCPRCKGGLERSVSPLPMGPWSGSVRCTKCSYQASVPSYLGQSMVRIEPLPAGALPDYAALAGGEPLETEDVEVVNRVLPDYGTEEVK